MPEAGNGKPKEKKKRSRRATIGFKIMEVDNNDLNKATFKPVSNGNSFKSVVECEKYIKKNAEKFAGKTLVIAHLKHKIQVQVKTKSVATITTA
jgi:hypothetical protein